MDEWTKHYPPLYLRKIRTMKPTSRPRSVLPEPNPNSPELHRGDFNCFLLKRTPAPPLTPQAHALQLQELARVMNEAQAQTRQLTRVNIALVAVVLVLSALLGSIMLRSGGAGEMAISTTEQ